MNAKEHNRLVAEFMDFIIEDGIIRYDPNFHKCGNKEGYRADGSLNFHESWSWLMPVIKKCNEITDGLILDINVYLFHLHALIHRALKVCDIKRTYEAVAEFIKEYNKHQWIVPWCNW